jgi:hypothetical protein
MNKSDPKTTSRSNIPTPGMGVLLFASALFTAAAHADYVPGGTLDPTFPCSSSIYTRR